MEKANKIFSRDLGCHSGGVWKWDKRADGRRVRKQNISVEMQNIKEYL